MSVQSTYNVLVPLPPLQHGDSDGSQYHALFNTLAGSIDVVDGDVARAVQACGPAPQHSLIQIGAGNRARSALAELPDDVLDYLDQRGYLFASHEEERSQAQLLYDEMLRFHRQVVRQPMVVIPSYNCDLKCPYCWQRLYHLDSPVMSEEMAEHLFEVIPSFVEVERADRVDLIIFGGEPLQDVAPLRERVLHLLALGHEKGYSTKIISNGVGLAANVPYLEGKVEVIQITIDGPADIHRRRRPLPGGRDSFTPMAEGISKAVAAGIAINVRVNTDETNLPRLPELADFAQQQGWLDTGKVRFHLAPVKNHNPRKETNSEAELLKKVLALVEQDDRMRIYDLGGFPGIKYFQGFKDSGLFSLHRFFNCEAQINFYGFDLKGDVYACWDAAGLQHLAVGRFHPEVEMDPAQLARWRKRTSLDIESCQGCSSSPHCGGGCQFLAFEHKDTFMTSSCDSMMEGYVQSILNHSGWLVERATSGDHAVGFITRSGVVNRVERPFGIIDASTDPANLPIGCA